MRQEFEIIKSRIDKKRLYKTVKDLTAYHRIQASTKYREAVKYVCDLCDKYHLDTKVLEYDADPNKWYLEYKSFKEWDIKEATLDIVEPNIRLCDFHSEPISVIQKSYPIDYRNNPIELIYLDDNLDVDVKGKMIFTHKWHSDVKWVFDKGAIGIVSDAIREDLNRKRSDLYESLTYTSFWYKHDENEYQPSGFVLSPKMGDMLEKLIKTSKEPIMVKPYINSSLYNGKFEVIESTIKGESDKCIIVNAHLCHPSSSANDNASGVACAIEIMHVLNELINEGLISRPKYSIKMLLVPEFTGTYAYLSDHNYLNIIGAINLDMVGARQDRTNGPITLTKMSLANASIINEIGTYAMSLANKEAYGLDNEAIAMTNNRIENYTGGSDHVVYGDPMFNMGAIMLGQWPDRNYHTSTDTIDKIDMEVLNYSASVGLYFSYILANLDNSYSDILFKELINNMHNEFNKAYNHYLNNDYSKELFDNKIIKLIRYYKDVVYNMSNLIDINDRLNDYVTYIEDSGNSFKKLTNIKEYNYPQTNNTIYKRNFVGPIHSVDDYSVKGYQKEIDEFKERIANIKHISDIDELIVFYLNGKNTISDIVYETSIETGVNTKEYVEAYLDLLCKLKLISKL